MIQTALVVLLVRRWAPGNLGSGGVGSIHSVPVLSRGTTAVAVGCLAGAAWWDVRALAGPRRRSRGPTPLLWFGRQFCGVMIVEQRRAPDLGAARAAGAVTPVRGVQRRAAWLCGSRRGWSTAWSSSCPCPLAYAAIPLSIWCAVRFSTYAAAVHAATFGAFAVALTLAGRGPFSTIEDPATGALLTQAFVLVALFTALVVGTLCDQREDVLARLTSSEATAAARARPPGGHDRGDDRGPGAWSTPPGRW